MWPLDCWDRGFESRGEHGCSYIVFAVCCVGSDPCDKLTTRPEECYLVCVCDDLETPKDRLGPELGCTATNKCINV